MYYSAKVVITKWDILGDLNHRKFFSHSSKGCKSKIKVPAVLVSIEDTFSGLQMATFLLCPQMVSPLYTYATSVSSLS